MSMLQEHLSGRANRIQLMIFIKVILWFKKKVDTDLSYYWLQYNMVLRKTVLCHFAVCICVCVHSASVAVKVPVSSFYFSGCWHESMCFLHNAAGEVTNAGLLFSVIWALYTASPEEIPSVFQHCINIDELPLLDGDEPAVSRVVVLQGAGYQDWMTAFRVSTEFLIW